MAKPLYRIVLREAWHATWRRKSLWVWGLFAGLLGNAGEYQLLLTASDRVASRQAFSEGAAALFQAPPITGRTVAGVWSALVTDPFATFVVLLVGLLIIAMAVFFIWLTMVSVVALISGTAVVAKGGEAPTLAEGVKVGSRFFGPVLVLYLFGKLVSWFLVTLLVLFGVLAVYDFLVGFPLLLVGFIVLVPALFVVSFVVRYAVMATVLRKGSLLDSIEWAIGLFRQSWLITVELAFVLFIVNLLASAALVSLVALFVIPILLAAFTVWQLGFAVWAVSLLTLGIGTFLVLLLVVGAALGTFQWTAWTTLYLKLHERGHESKLARWMTALLGSRTVAMRKT